MARIPHKFVTRDTQQSYCSILLYTGVSYKKWLACYHFLEGEGDGDI